MTKMIYIATYEAGRPAPAHVTAFNGKRDLVSYADTVTARGDTVINATDTIDTICEKLEDKGPGFGSRWAV